MSLFFSHVFFDPRTLVLIVEIVNVFSFFLFVFESFLLTFGNYRWLGSSQLSISTITTSTQRIVLKKFLDVFFDSWTFVLIVEIVNVFSFFLFVLFGDLIFSFFDSYPKTFTKIRQLRMTTTTTTRTNTTTTTI